MLPMPVGGYDSKPSLKITLKWAGCADIRGTNCAIMCKGQKDADTFKSMLLKRLEIEGSST